MIEIETKITPLRIITSKVPNGYGTGRRNGMEIIPFTKTGQVKLGIDPIIELDPPAPKEDIPTEILEPLRPYQKEDVKLLSNRAVGMILSEPRTGKTPTAISVFRAKGLKKYLVVCPTSIVYQWADEIERWGNLEAIPVRGTKKKRYKIYSGWASGVIVIGYESFRNDYKEIIAQNDDIEGMIVDESHRINNRKTLQYKAAKAVGSKVKHKLVLTGTLSPNKQHEVFGSLSFCYPNIFTGYWRFIDYYFHKEEQMNWGRMSKYIEIGSIRHPTELQEFLDRVSVNRTQKEVMPWLPDKDYVPIRLEPTTYQNKYMKELLTMFETSSGEVEIITQGVLDQLIRVRQIANDPGLLGLKGKSPKTQWIERYLKDYPERPTIIFSTFTSYLKKISEELDIPYLIIGETPTERREALKQAFQNGDINVLLINVQAGKEGLTLDRAHAAIFCDNYPPAADIMQAENRITATTEDRASKPNTIYQLMMKGTYDEDLYQMVADNIEESNMINKFKEYLEEYRKG